jgi:hypothetical protein
MPVVVASSDIHAPDRVDLILLGEFCEENGGFGREVVVDAHHFLTFGKHTDGTATEWVAAGVEVNLRRLKGRFRWLRACLKMGGDPPHFQTGSNGRLPGTVFDVEDSLVHKPSA